jgi:ERCC4-type nuclease
MLLFDNRERGLLALYPPGTPQAALPVGDVWIGVSGEALCAGAIVAERKTVADLEASILDGRYREQRTRLVATATEAGARPLYILEGQWYSGTGRLGPKALKKHVTRLAIRYGIAVIRTDDKVGTKDVIDLLAEQIAAEPTCFVAADAAAVAYTSTVQTKKRDNREDPAVFASAALQQCPGVSAKIADALVAEFKSFAGVFGAAEADIAAVKAGTRRVGPAVAGRLWRLLHNS